MSSVMSTTGAANGLTTNINSFTYELTCLSSYDGVFETSILNTMAVAKRKNGTLSTYRGIPLNQASYTLTLALT